VAGRRGGEVGSSSFLAGSRPSRRGRRAWPPFSCQRSPGCRAKPWARPGFGVWATSSAATGKWAGQQRRIGCRTGRCGSGAANWGACAGPGGDGAVLDHVVVRSAAWMAAEGRKAEVRVVPGQGESGRRCRHPVAGGGGCRPRGRRGSCRRAHRDGESAGRATSSVLRHSRGTSRHASAPSPPPGRRAAVAGRRRAAPHRRGHGWRLGCEPEPAAAANPGSSGDARLGR